MSRRRRRTRSPHTSRIGIKTAGGTAPPARHSLTPTGLSSGPEIRARLRTCPRRFGLGIDVRLELAKRVGQRLALIYHAVLQHHERNAGVARRVGHGEELLGAVEVSRRQVELRARIQD